ncbi:MAG: hypothetical protein IJY52_02725, partial [Anaerotignum sp.]|nr:hypothetical protein [Anaerotignum sp.]
MVTWKELQETCLRKMDSLDGASLVNDSNTRAYINAMPAAANEALHLLATNGRYWKKMLTIEQDGTAQTGELLGGFIAYDLKQLAANFYCIDQVKLVNGSEYGNYDGYTMEGDSIMLIPADETGSFRIWYNAYPTKITSQTAEDFVIDIHPEAANIIAHYMAGQLYKHDDISVAQIYMNEFFEWLSNLQESGQKADGRNASGGGWT